MLQLLPDTPFTRQTPKLDPCNMLHTRLAPQCAHEPAPFPPAWNSVVGTWSVASHLAPFCICEGIPSTLVRSLITCGTDGGVIHNRREPAHLLPRIAPNPMLPQHIAHRGYPHREPAHLPLIHTRPLFLIELSSLIRLRRALFEPEPQSRRQSSRHPDFVIRV